MKQDHAVPRIRGGAGRSRFAGALRRAAAHWPALVVGVGVHATGSAWLAASWFVASRLAYVLFVGTALRAEDRRDDRGEGRGAAWERFSARASWLMDNDAVAFVALCLVTAGVFPPGIPWTATVVAGFLLCVVGVGVKVLAAASLPVGSYHWRDFFLLPESRTLLAPGLYRWVSNPMYTLGYAHVYGLALALRSWPGLAAGAFAQASILLLLVLVELPHLRRHRARKGEGPFRKPG